MLIFLMDKYILCVLHRYSFALLFKEHDDISRIVIKYSFSYLNIIVRGSLDLVAYRGRQTY